MLRTLRINPKISMATHLNGQYEYKRAPMAPPDTRSIAHETPNRRRTWAPHGQKGWYIGPALEHYRCYRVYFNKTRSERVVEMVELFPMEVKVTLPS
jgi:predicted Abi (CAAX) family protease